MKEQTLTIFYDGLCHLCSMEINHYRKKDKQNKIKFVDIAAPDFNATEFGLDAKEVHKNFHVKNEQGEILTKVDGFIAIWDALGVFRPLSYIAKTSVLRPVFDLGYFAFSKARPFLPRKNCEDGSCHI